jgi:hypothetical protein
MRPGKRAVWAATSVLVILIAYTAAFGVRVYARGYDKFFRDYVRWLATPAPVVTAPVYVFVLFADHFEPDYDAARVVRWSHRYQALAARHHDSAGRPPQHTFFYPAEQAQPEVFSELRRLTQAGLGEVELHYHHDFDTADTLRPKLQRAIEEMQEYGFLRTVAGETRFGFIHGNWGLDNADGPFLCGVNDELRLLHQLGCFADFTFPSVYADAQPPFVNTIYAAKDDDRPKSYRDALPLTELDRSADLMIFQGPLLFAPSLSVRRLFFDLDDGNIHPAVPASPRRTDRWVHANVHVTERPDWVFVKVFAHGISTPEDEEVVLGPSFDETLSYLEHRYNDGQRYRLRYITAREAYNLAHAAAFGERGNPDGYLNYPIAPYVADRNPQRDPSPLLSQVEPAAASLQSCVRRRS